MTEKRRFGALSEDEILSKRQAAVPKNTQKCNTGAATLFREYLREKEMDTDFEQYDETTLVKTLGPFYLNARTKGGELYKATTFENFRYSLNRYLKSPPVMKTYNIISSHSFTEANECFKAALCEIKKAGKGAVEHYPMITLTDLRKLYSSIYLGRTSLQAC